MSSSHKYDKSFEFLSVAAPERIRRFAGDASVMQSGSNGRTLGAIEEEEEEEEEQVFARFAIIITKSLWLHTIQSAIRSDPTTNRILLNSVVQSTLGAVDDFA